MAAFRCFPWEQSNKLADSSKSLVFPKVFPHDEIKQSMHWAGGKMINTNTSKSYPERQSASAG